MVTSYLPLHRMSVMTITCAFHLFFDHFCSSRKEIALGISVGGSFAAQAKGKAVWCALSQNVGRKHYRQIRNNVL